jgi:hypothetical protein
MNPDVVAHAYNPSIWEAKAGGSQVPGQSGLQSLSTPNPPKKKKKKPNKPKKQKPKKDITDSSRDPI